MSTTLQHAATIWLCVDCTLTLANGECSERPDRIPLGEVDSEITLGITSDQHDNHCTESDRDEQRCGCEHLDFTWSGCEGCGSRLAGERYAATIWY